MIGTDSTLEFIAVRTHTSHNLQHLPQVQSIHSTLGNSDHLIVMPSCHFLDALN